jgi:anti-sigma factor RsiW
MTCAEVEEMAGLYVLDALEADHAQAVSEHLASCPAAHEAYAELASTTSALASTVDQQQPPAGLRDRVLAAVAATPQVPDAAAAPREAATDIGIETGSDRGDTDAARGPSWLARLRGADTDQGRIRGWAAAGTAAGVIAVFLVAVGLVGSLRLQTESVERLALLRGAVAAAADPTANVAVLAGSAFADGASGYAVFLDGEQGYIVIDGLPAAPEGQTYQAWYLSGGVPTSAGLITYSKDGLGTLTGLDPISGTDIIALTIEDLPGVESPTGDPVVVGELRAPTALVTGPVL